MQAQFYIPSVTYEVGIKTQNSVLGNVRFSGTYTSYYVNSEGYNVYTVLAGNQVSLIATANTGYRFVQWSNSQTANPYTFNVSANIYLTAAFEVNPITPEAATIMQLQSSTGSINVGLTGTLVGTLLDPTLTYEFY